MNQAERLIRRLIATRTPEQALPLLGRPDVLTLIARHTGPGAVVMLPELDHLIEVDERGRARLACMKCEVATSPAMQKLPAAKYRHQFSHPFYIVEWDNQRAWELVRRSGRAPAPIPLPWVRQWLKLSASLTPGHIDHIPPEHRDDPILCSVVPKIVYQDARGKPDAGKPVQIPFPVLIDGHHRAALAARDDRPLLGFVLTEEEQMAVARVELDAYDPELMGWRTRAEVEALPMDQFTVPNWIPTIEVPNDGNTPTPRTGQDAGRPQGRP